MVSRAACLGGRACRYRLGIDDRGSRRSAALLRRPLRRHRWCGVGSREDGTVALAIGGWWRRPRVAFRLEVVHLVHRVAGWAPGCRLGGLIRASSLAHPERDDVAAPLLPPLRVGLRVRTGWGGEGGEARGVWWGLAVAVWPRARAEAGFCTCQPAARARPSLELYLWRVRVTVRQVERRVCSNSGFGLGVRALGVRDGGEAVLSRRSARASGSGESYTWWIGLRSRRRR